MNKQQRKARTKLLEDIVNAQQELIAIYDQTITAVDSADIAIASVADPYENRMIGQNLQDIREEHFDREMELEDELRGLFDKLEGKHLPPKEIPVTVEKK